MSTLLSLGSRVVLPAPDGGAQMDRMYRIGALALVALTTAAEGEDAVFALGGNRLLPKAAGVAFTAGELVFYDPSEHTVNKSAAGRFPIGACIKAAGEADPRVRIRLFDQATAPIE